MKNKKYLWIVFAVVLLLAVLLVWRPWGGAAQDVGSENSAVTEKEEASVPSDTDETKPRGENGTGASARSDSGEDNSEKDGENSDEGGSDLPDASAPADEGRPSQNEPGTSSSPEEDKESEEEDSEWHGLESDDEDEIIISDDMGTGGL